MEPQPPRKPKENRPFYAPPEDKPIAVQIINEARSSLKELKTKRPFTPRDDRRTLFGSRPVNTSDNRPPSAFSLDSRHFDPDSRPVSGTRLSPLDHVAKLPSEAEVEGLLLPPRPPSDASKPSRKAPRARTQHANSVEGSTVSESQKSRNGTLSDDSPCKESGQITPERVGSGNKERSLAIEERGEGDGKEAPPHRAPSAASNTPVSSVSSVRTDVEERLGSGGSKRTGHDVEARVGSGGSKRGGHDTDSRVGSGGTKRTSSAGSRGGSAGKREDDSQEELEFYTNHISPLLELMAEYSQKKDVQKIISLSEDLYQLLQKNNLLSKTYKQRSRILKSIFKMLDLEEPQLLLQLARLILAIVAEDLFRVGGNNLLNVCKLVFKVSRNEKNDPAFLDGNILELLLETMNGVDILGTHEALIYCVGSLKFLTGNATIAKQLVQKHCIEKLSTLLDSIIKLIGENSHNPEQLGNILVQLTAALRNLADTGSSRDKILNCRLLDSLTLVSDSYAGDWEIVLNVSRIFSKVTLHTDCCMALSENVLSYKVFLHLLKKHLKRQDIVVRVSFILGNMTAKNDNARVQLFQQPKSLDILLTVLKTHLELDYKTRNKLEKKDKPKSDGGNEDTNKHEDVLVKIVRVIANVSINDEVGPQVATSNQCVELLIRILETKDIESSEELVLNTVACINNLSYFNSKHSAITTHQMKLVDCLMKLVLGESMMKSIVEVSRVFGNLTGQKQVRDFLHQQQVDKVLITLLDSGDKEVVYIACGVLINFMVDEEKRHVLKKESGITKLVEVLRDFGRGDWELAGMVCQTLWNYSGKITSSNACFGHIEAQELTEILVDFLDKENVYDSELTQMDEDLQEYIMDCWETQFCPVAEQLLNRIESHNSNFEPLPSGAS
ncbi:armadillo repeat-containing protein 2-like isoform X3 [Ruditapes philippinarum]|uniref:armadillo repeat-containing protein 2-like isoform X3 n=1 Tax=Ruditapes philippinarum TaxID=129788 RepID=UPI00295AD3A2|nr:armadillo repeat-containing protein 2-like isoform X3 [Ruditapes philippinarum]